MQSPPDLSCQFFTARILNILNITRSSVPFLYRVKSKTRMRSRVYHYQLQILPKSPNAVLHYITDFKRKLYLAA